MYVLIFFNINKYMNSTIINLLVNNSKCQFIQKHTCMFETFKKRKQNLYQRNEVNMPFIFCIYSLRYLNVHRIKGKTYFLIHVLYILFKNIHIYLFQQVILLLQSLSTGPQIVNIKLVGPIGGIHVGFTTYVSCIQTYIGYKSIV